MMEGAIDRFAKMLDVDRESVSSVVSSDVPLQRLAEPFEISGIYLYLASDDSSFTTGSVFLVDGGASAVDVGRVAVGRALRNSCDMSPSRPPGIKTFAVFPDDVKIDTFRILQGGYSPR